MVRPSISPDHGCDLQLLQRRRKYVLTLGISVCVLLLMVTASSWRTWPRVHELFERSGLLLILVCILGRTWCTLYIGGLKKRELVRKGPYSVVRNPLYIFTVVGAAEHHQRGALQRVRKLRRSWESVAKFAGSSGKDGPHILRHTAATWMMRSSGSSARSGSPISRRR